MTSSEAPLVDVDKDQLKEFDGESSESIGGLSKSALSSVGSMSNVSLYPFSLENSTNNLQEEKTSSKEKAKDKDKGKTNLKYSLFIDDNSTDDDINEKDNKLVLMKEDLEKEKEKDSDSDINSIDSIESLSYIKEIYLMFKMSIPISIGNFARLAMYNIDSIFLGHLGTNELAGVALSMILMEIVTTFVYSPAWSLNGICSQAIGAGNSKLSGIWLQLSIEICFIVSLPALIVYWYIADIIALFNNNNDVIYFARVFSHYAGLWLFLGAMAMAIRGYLQSIEVILPLTIVPIITIICDALLNWILIYGINIKLLNINIHWNGLGFIGSPLATFTSVIIQLLCFYIWCFKYKKYHIKKNAWKKWSLKETLFNMNRVKSYSKILVPNMIADATENWAYQVIVILCGTLPSSSIAALSSCFDCWGALWSFYSGFGACTITKIGKEIGKGNIKRAKFFASVCVITGSIVTITIGTLCFLFSNHIGRLYSNDKKVIEIMDISLKIISVVYFLGSIGWTASNIMESMSKNKERGIIMVVTAWFIFIPLGLYMAFDNNNIFKNILKGGNCSVCMVFWSCIFVESLRTIILWIILIYKVDWKKQSMYAMIRSEINETIIANKLNLDLNYVRKESTKTKSEIKENSNENNKEKDNDNEATEKTNNNDDKISRKEENIEYISLYNEETFSTSVEIETIVNEKEKNKKSLKINKLKLSSNNKLNNKQKDKRLGNLNLILNGNDLLLENEKSQIQAA